jgi:hypothetical protein
LYADLARRIAADAEILEFLEGLPRAKRQPNLLLASYRSLLGTPDSWASFREQLLNSRGKLKERILERSTQTNEPARCATLLPLLARLPQPLALIEVGAAAGLCLLLDHYSYVYGDHRLGPAEDDAPVFYCGHSPNLPLPAALPRVAWRAGLDLNPLDPEDEEEMQWLQTLVWPGEEYRIENLRRTIAIARRERPHVMKGDLLTDLSSLVAKVPPGLTIVVFHTAVLSYVQPQAAREAFAIQVRGLCDVWISNEGASVFPGIAAQAGESRPGKFLLAQNGAPVAWTDPHGLSIEWIAEA